MRKAGEEVNLNDFLTSYLKNFKIYLHAQLTMIQSLSTDISNIYQKIKKVKQGTTLINQQVAQLSSMVNRINWKTVQRFCMRINQYIQYRITKSKSLVEKFVIDQLESMCCSLHHLFARVGKDELSDEQEIILNFFKQIADIIDKSISKVLRKILEIFTNKKIFQSERRLLKIFLIQRINAKNSIKNDIQQTEPSQNVSNKSRNTDYISKTSQTHYASRLRPRKNQLQKIQQIPSSHSYAENIDVLSIIRSKASTAQSQLALFNSQMFQRENYGHFDSVSLNQDRTFEKQFIQEQKNNIKLYEQQESIKLERQSSRIKFVSNHRYKNIDDILQLDYQCYEKHSQQQVLKQMLQNNKKNIIMIQKFRKKAKKRISKLEAEVLESIGSHTIDIDLIKHKRSNTLSTVRSKQSIKKVDKFLELPSLKKKSSKIS